jgi:hypothetical protein
MVGPTNLKPRRRSSWLIASLAATAFRLPGPRSGFPSTKPHTSASKLPNSFLASRYARAFATTASIFARFLTIPSSRINALRFAAV